MAKSSGSSRPPEPSREAPSEPPSTGELSSELNLATRYPALGRYCPHPPSPKQAAFLLLDEPEFGGPRREAFYGGAAGGGKSDALLMAAFQYVDVPGYAAILLRRTFAELEGADGLIQRAHEWLGKFRVAGEVAWNENKHRWTFPSGATVEFGHVKDELDKHIYQSRAYQFVGFDELTSFTETQYDYIAFSRQRRRKAGPIAKVPIRVRSASNPGGVGHGWVKRRFVTQREDGVIFIPARVADNPGLDVKDYVEGSLSKLSEVLRQQLLDGDWGVFEGMAFSDYDETVHGYRMIGLPDSFDRFECMDYGVSSPTAWFLVGVDYDGNLLFHDSYYRPGIPSVTAPVILARRAAGWERGASWGGGWGGNDCYADPTITHRTSGLTRWGEPATVSTEFEEEGIHLTPANNDPRTGYTRLRTLLRPDPDRVFPSWHHRAGQKGSPRMFVHVDNCPELGEQLRTAPLQPIDKRYGGEMVNPDWEGEHGHATASARYGAMSRPDASSEPTEEESDLRAAAFKRALRQTSEEFEEEAAWA